MFQAVYEKYKNEKHVLKKKNVSFQKKKCSSSHSPGKSCKDGMTRFSFLSILPWLSSKGKQSLISLIWPLMHLPRFLLLFCATFFVFFLKEASKTYQTLHLRRNLQHSTFKWALQAYLRLQVTSRKHLQYSSKIIYEKIYKLGFCRNVKMTVGGSAV